MNRALELKIVSQISVIIQFAISPWQRPGESVGTVSAAGAGRFRPTSVPTSIIPGRVPSRDGAVGWGEEIRGQWSDQGRREPQLV